MLALNDNLPLNSRDESHLIVLYDVFNDCCGSTYDRSQGERREQEVERVGGTYIKGMGRRKGKNGQEGRKWD